MRLFLALRITLRHAIAMTAKQKVDALMMRKGKQRITALTAYDYPMARLLDEAEIDVLLVGDSLGMVVLGFPDTTHVTMDHMLHHIAAVARAQPRALILGDLPIHSYNTPGKAVHSALRLREAGAEAVKLEGGISEAEKVTAIVAAGIPVIGHIGMLPQHVLEEGGYRKKGKNERTAKALIDDAKALEQAGVCAIVLESIIADVAVRITASINVPTIGIGCGDATCDGEVAVITDLLGSYPWFVPPFAKPEAQLAPQIIAAARAFRARIQQ